MNEAKNILKQVSLLIKKSEEISRLKGERFNIFSVLRNETEEVTTHNRLIAEFLNPKGSHGMGTTFLHLFYDTLLESELCCLSDDKKAILQSIKNSTATVIAEEWLGNVDLKNVEGGSIDVCVKTDNGQVRIENKIYAGDQNKQIARYCSNHKKENNIIIYLTLFGSDASKESKQNQIKGTDYFLLSHYSDTINWLDKCYRATTEFPILRETVRQYQILMKKLTNQHTSQEMKEELLDLLTQSSENYKAAQEIAASLQEAQKRIWIKLLNLISKKLISNGYSAIDSHRGVRTDGGFVSVIQITIEAVKYDVGVNLEFGNNHFFFCVIEKGKNRNSVITNQKKFDKLATYLDSKEYSCYNSGKRSGFSLNGVFKLKSSFSIDNYLQFTDKQKNEFSESIVNELMKTIKESNLESYSEK